VHPSESKGGESAATPTLDVTSARLSEREATNRKRDGKADQERVPEEASNENARVVQDFEGIGREMNDDEVHEEVDQDPEGRA